MEVHDSSYLVTYSVTNVKPCNADQKQTGVMRLNRVSTQAVVRVNFEQFVDESLV